MPVQAKRIDEVFSEYNNFVDSRGWSKEDYPIEQFAKDMDAIEGTPSRSAAYEIGVTDHINRWVNKALSPTRVITEPAGDVLGYGTEQLMSAVGYESPELAEQVSDVVQEMPRFALEMAPWMRGGRLLTRAASAGSAFTRGTSEYNDPVAGFIDAATLPTIVKGGRIGENKVLRSMAKRNLRKGAPAREVYEEAADLLKTGQGALRREAATQAGMFAGGMVGDAALSASQGGLGATADLVTDPDYYILNVIGQMPLLPMDVARIRAEVKEGRSRQKAEHKIREEIFNKIVGVRSEADRTNAQLDEIITRMRAIEETKSRQSEEYNKLEHEWYRLAPKINLETRKQTEGYVRPPKMESFRVTPELWQRLSSLREETPTELVQLTKAYNETLNVLRESDELRTLELLRATDEIFGDQPVTAETIQKKFSEFLENGYRPSEATTKIFNLMRNKLGRITNESLRSPKNEYKPTELELEAIREQYPNIDNLNNMSNFMRLQFENKGYSPEVVNEFVNITRRILTTAPTETRFGVLRGEEIKAVKGLASHFSRLVGLSEDSGNTGLRQIITLAHEIFHDYQYKMSREDTSQASPEIKQMAKDYQNVLDFISTENPETLLTALEKLAYTLFGPEQTIIPPSRLNIYRNYLSSNRLSEPENVAFIQEYTADLMGMLIVAGTHDPNLTRSGRTSIDQQRALANAKEQQEAMRWMPDEITNAAFGQSRNIHDALNVIRSWYESRLKAFPTKKRENDNRLTIPTFRYLGEGYYAVNDPKLFNFSSDGDQTGLIGTLNKNLKLFYLDKSLAEQGMIGNEIFQTYKRDSETDLSPADVDGQMVVDFYVNQLGPSSKNLDKVLEQIKTIINLDGVVYNENRIDNAFRQTEEQAAPDDPIRSNEGLILFDDPRDKINLIPYKSKDIENFYSDLIKKFRKATFSMEKMAKLFNRIQKDRAQVVKMMDYLNPDYVPDVRIDTELFEGAKRSLSYLRNEFGFNFSVDEPPAIFGDEPSASLESGEVPLNNLTAQERKRIERMRAEEKETGESIVDKFRRDLGLYTREDLKLTRGSQLGAIEKFLGNPSQIARKLEKMGLNAAAQVIWHVQDLPASVEGYRNHMMKPFTSYNKHGNIVNLLDYDGKHLPREALETKSIIDLVMTNEDAWAAFSDIALLHNRLKQRLRPDKEPFLNELNKGNVRGYNNLSAEQKNQVWQLSEMVLQQNREASTLLQGGQLQILGIQAAKRLRHYNPQLSSEAAMQIGMSLFNTVGKQVGEFQTNPEGALDRIQQELKEQFGSDVNFDKAVQFVGDMAPKYIEMVQKLNDQAEYFFSERRFGNYILYYNRKGDKDVVTEGFREKSDVYERRKQLERDPNVSNLNVINKRDNRDEPIPIGRDKFLENLKDLENAAYESALRDLGEEEAAKLRQAYKPMESALDKVRKDQVSDFMKERKLKPGREYLDMFTTAIDYYNALSYKLAGDYANAYADFMLSDNSMRRNQDIRKMIEDWTNNLLRPNSTEYQKIKNGIFSYFLGFNLSSMIIESVQPVITTMPMIVEQTGSFRESSKLLTKAYMSIAEAYRNPRSKRGRLQFSDEKMTKYFNRAIDERIMEYGSIEDMVNPTDAQQFNIARMKKGQTRFSAKEIATKPLHWYAKQSRILYSTVSGMNAKASFYIGFDIGKTKGLTDEQAYSFAKNFIRETTFSGGVYNRAFGFYKMGKAQGAAGVLYTLNNFTFATIHMMSRLIKDAINTDVPPEQRAKAKKAAAQMLGAQFLMAGATGMPFTGAAITILEDIFGETIRDDIRRNAFELGGEGEFGQHFADVVTRGLPTLLGVDAQSRFGLGSVMGFSEYSGFDTADFTGAAGGVLRNLYASMGELAKQNYGKALEEAVPQAMKKAVEFARTDGNFVDNKGELIMEPTRTEQLAYLIGFQPKRYSDIRLIQRVSRQADQIANEKRREALNELVERSSDMTPLMIRGELINLISNNPYFEYDDFQSVVNRFVEIQMEKQVPIEPNESGSYASLPERKRFSETLPPIRKRRISEQQKLLLKHRLQSDLMGTPQMPTQREMTRAQMIDQFMNQDPQMSSQEARLKLRQLGI